MEQRRRDAKRARPSRSCLASRALLLASLAAPARARDVGRLLLWRLLSEGALNFTHNDSIVEFGVDPARAGNLTLDPPALREPLLPGVALPTAALPASGGGGSGGGGGGGGGGGPLRRGPLLGLNRSVHVCVMRPPPAAASPAAGAAAPAAAPIAQWAEACTRGGGGEALGVTGLPPCLSLTPKSMWVAPHVR